jgi:YtkA-like
MGGNALGQVHPPGRSSVCPRPFMLLLSALLLALLAVGSFQTRSRPEKLDVSRVRFSERGLFRVDVGKTEIEPIPLRRVHAWTIHVADASGRPVAAASIIVDGGMPEHGHGLPTQPEVTKNLGNGDYLVEGLKFQMKGWWEVKFSIATSEKTDEVVFNLIL